GNACWLCHEERRIRRCGREHHNLSNDVSLRYVFPDQFNAAIPADFRACPAAVLSNRRTQQRDALCELLGSSVRYCSANHPLCSGLCPGSEVLQVARRLAHSSSARRSASALETSS